MQMTWLTPLQEQALNEELSLVLHVCPQSRLNKLKWDSKSLDGPDELGLPSSLYIHMQVGGRDGNISTQETVHFSDQLERGEWFCIYIQVSRLWWF